MTPNMLNDIRKFGAGLIAVLAIVVLFVAGPTEADRSPTADYARMLTAAQSDYDTNDARTSGAPQQQVVNGWFARDALTIQVMQLTDLLEAAEPAPPDERVTLIALLGVIAICLYAFTSPSPARRHDDDDLEVLEGESAATGVDADRPSIDSLRPPPPAGYTDGPAAPLGSGPPTDE